MTSPDRRAGFWHRIFGHASRTAREPTSPPPPLFPLRPVQPAPRGPGLPAWTEILSAAPPVTEPAAASAAPGASHLALVPNASRVARRPPNDEEKRVLADIAGLLGAGQIGAAAALLDATFRARPEVGDARGRPIYLLESLHCALLLGEAAAAADRVQRLRPHLAPDDPVVEALYARLAVAAGDRAAARANWLAALARAPDLAEARDWLAANPASPPGGIAAFDLLGPMVQAFADRIQPAPAPNVAPDTPVEIPDWAPGRLLAPAALTVAEAGPVLAAPAADGAAPAAWQGAPDELALALLHPQGLDKPHAFAEVLLTAFVLQRQYLGHLRPARVYIGRQAWAQTHIQGAAVAPQLEMLAVLFPGIRVVGDHDGSWHEPNLLVVDGAARNKATGTLFGAMMPQVVKWMADARGRAHAACGLPETAIPPRQPGRRPRVLYLNAPPPRALADAVRERLFALFASAGFAVTMIDPATMPWHRQVCLVYGADIVAGTHGPALAPAVWAHPQTRVMEFFPEGTRRYDGQLLAEAGGLGYLGLEGVAERGFVIQARERWGPPFGDHVGRLIWALPWTLLERAFAPPKAAGG